MTGAPSRRGAIELSGLVRRFGDATAVAGIELDIEAGEFFALLGPSGCGKTTTLRMIGGFLEPTSGTIRLDGVDLAGTPAHRRPVNTVFQSYALFPHLSVAENIAYGLRWRRGIDRDARRERVGNALELVRLSALANRRPHQLSGGEQQRVALARALVCEPAVLLLDEPLGALDAKLRKALRAELMELHQEVGTTFVLVTHDQEEALEMSDRLAVMDHGRVVQCGRPKEVYEEPATEFVADFLGLANLLDVTAVTPSSSGRATVRLGEFSLDAICDASPPAGSGRVVIRPERVRLGASGPNTIPAIVDNVVYVGAMTQVKVRLPAAVPVQPGEWLGEDAAKDLLGAAGVPVPAGTCVSTVESAVEAAAGLGGAVAMKLTAPSLRHKSEAGAVLLSVEGSEAVRSGFERLRSVPGHASTPVLVEAMSPARCGARRGSAPARRGAGTRARSRRRVGRAVRRRPADPAARDTGPGRLPCRGPTGRCAAHRLPWPTRRRPGGARAAVCRRGNPCGGTGVGADRAQSGDRPPPMAWSPPMP